MIPNVLTLIIFIYFVGAIGNHNEVFHNELKMAHAIKDNDYEKALKIGIKSPHSSQTLTAMRALALSSIDSLGQRLFFYTQENGANGLFIDEREGKRSTITNDSIYKHLGGIDRKYNEPAVNYLRRICESDTASSHARDYYLCALLLERQLSVFNQALKTYYNQDEMLPRHYLEALILLHDKEKKGIQTITTDSLIIKDYDAFKSLQQSYDEEELKSNYTRRKFGNTYWWYFWYGE